MKLICTTDRLISFKTAQCFAMAIGIGIAVADPGFPEGGGGRRPKWGGAKVRCGNVAEN